VVLFVYRSNDPRNAGREIFWEVFPHGGKNAGTTTDNGSFIADEMGNGSAEVRVSHGMHKGHMWVQGAQGNGKWKVLHCNAGEAPPPPPPPTPGEIALTKSGPKEARRGETITYYFEVSNPSESPLSNVRVTDPMLGGLIWSGSLTPGQSVSFSKSYTVKEDDTDPLGNTATATGVDQCGNTVRATASWSVDLLDDEEPKKKPTKTRRICVYAPGYAVEQLGPLFLESELKAEAWDWLCVDVEINSTAYFLLWNHRTGGHSGPRFSVTVTEEGPTVEIDGYDPLAAMAEYEGIEIEILGGYPEGYGEEGSNVILSSPPGAPQIE
jgi:uncharacterized repeat protein (TIGR01451 family)